MAVCVAALLLLGAACLADPSRPLVHINAGYGRPQTDHFNNDVANAPSFNVEQKGDIFLRRKRDSPMSGGTESGGAKSSGAKSSGAKSSGAKSSGAKSSGAESGGAKGSGAESGGSKSEGAESEGAASPPKSSVGVASATASSVSINGDLPASDGGALTSKSPSMKKEEDEEEDSGESGETSTGPTNDPEMLSKSDTADKAATGSGSTARKPSGSKSDNQSGGPRDRAQLQISIKALGPWRDLFSRRSALDLRNYMLIPHMERGRVHHANEHGARPPYNAGAGGAQQGLGRNQGSSNQGPVRNQGNNMNQEPVQGGMNPGNNMNQGPVQGGMNQGKNMNQGNNVKAMRNLGASPIYDSQPSIPQDYNDQALGEGLEPDPLGGKRQPFGPPSGARDQEHRSAATQDGRPIHSYSDPILNARPI